MQRAKHQVTGLGRGQGGADGLEVSHLTNQNHVGVLAEDVLERIVEAEGIGAYFPLIDDRFLVLVEELDGILDGHDVDRSLLVDEIDDGCERGRLS